MGTLLIETEEIEINVTYSSGTIDADNKLILDLITHLRDLHTSTPLVNLVVTNTGAKDFSFVAELQDGRIWQQTLRMNGADFQMTFDCVDWWHCSECEKFNFIRIDIANLYNSNIITLLTVDWK